MMRPLVRGAAAATLIAGLALPSLAGAQPDYYGDPQPRYGTNPGQYNDPHQYRDDRDYDQDEGGYDQGQDEARPDAGDDTRSYDDSQGDRTDDGDRDYGSQDDDRYGGQYEERGDDTQRSYAQSYGSGAQTWRDAWGRTCRWRDQTGRDDEGYVTQRWVQYCR
jgi:hypothetical protein